MNRLTNLSDMPPHEITLLRISYEYPTKILRNCGRLHCLLIFTPKPQGQNVSTRLLSWPRPWTPTKILRQAYGFPTNWGGFQFVILGSVLYGRKPASTDKVIMWEYDWWNRCWGHQERDLRIQDDSSQTTDCFPTNILGISYENPTNLRGYH